MKTTFPSDDKFNLMDSIRKDIMQAKTDGKFVCGIVITYNALLSLFGIINPGTAIDLNTARIMGYPVVDTETYGGEYSILIDHPEFPAFRAIYDYWVVTEKLPKIVFIGADPDATYEDYEQSGSIPIKRTLALPVGKAVCA